MACCKLFKKVNFPRIPVDPERPQLVIFFDIDEVLCTKPNLNLQKSHYLYLYRKSTIFNILGNPHLIFPGVIELMRYLHSIPNVKVAFFSSGLRERNAEFVRQLLTEALGEREYNHIKKSLIILSREHLTNYQKDLSKVLSSLKHVIIVDDNDDVIPTEQEKNHLYSYGSIEHYYRFDDSREENKTSFYEENSPCYVAYVLSKCISTFQSSGNVLNTLQIIKKHPIQFFFYEQGQAILDNIPFVSKEDYAETIEEKATRDEEETLAPALAMSVEEDEEIDQIPSCSVM